MNQTITHGHFDRVALKCVCNYGCELYIVSVSLWIGKKWLFFFVIHFPPYQTK